MLRQLLTFIFKTASFIAVLCALLLGGVTAALHFELTRQPILSWALAEIADGTGWLLEVEHIADFSLTHIQAEGLQGHSSTGGAFYLDALSLNFSPWQLVVGRAAFPHVHLDGITIDPTAAKVQISPTTPLVNMPWMWLSFDIQKFELRNLRLPSGKLPSPFKGLSQDLLHVAGSVQVSPRHGGAMVEAAIFSEKAPEDTTIVSGYLFLEEPRLEFLGRIVEEKTGLFGRAVGIPAGLGYEITGAASAPLSQIAQSLIAGAFHPELIVDGELSVYSHCEEIEAHKPQWIQPWSLEGAFRWTPGGGLVFDHLRVGGDLDEAPFSLEGSLAIDRNMENYHSHFELAIADFKDLETHLGHFSGSLEGVGKLSGSWDAAQVDLQLSVTDLLSQGYTLEALQVHLQGDLSRLHSELEVALTAPVGPVATNASFLLSWDDGPHLHLNKLQWHSPTARLGGDLYLLLGEKPLFTGKLSGDTGDLSWLSPFLDTEIAGSGTLELNLATSDNGTQAAKANLSLNEVVLGDSTIEHLSWDLDFDDVLSKASGTMFLQLSGGVRGKDRLKELKLSLTVPQNKGPWPFELQGHGRWQGRFRLTCDGELDLTNIPTLTFSHLDARLQGQPLRLLQPWTGSWAPDVFSFSDLHLKAGTGELSSHFNWTEHTPAMRIESRAVPIDMLEPWLSFTPASGELTGAIDIGGSWTSPVATFQMTIDNLELWKAAEAQAQLTGTLKKGSLDTSGHIHGIGNRPIEVTAQLPLRWSLAPWDIDFPTDRELTAHIEADGNVSSLLQLAIPDATSFTGQAHLAFDIHGTYDTPLVTGQLDLRDCVYEGIETGSIYRNIQAKVEGTGRDIVLKELSADDDGQGHLSGRGKVTLDLEQGHPFQLDLELDRASVLRRDYINASATGHLTLLGTTQDVTLKGKLKTDTLNISIPDELPTPAASLDITYVHKTLDANTSATTAASTPPFKLDVTLDIPEKASITSRDYRSTWQGQLAITGDMKTPLMHGSLKLLSGDYSISGRDFVLTKGSIQFDGSLDKKTTLYVIAAQQYDNYTIEAVVKGPIRSTAITLRANPYLSQREIASWIIFNKGLDEASPFEQDIADEFAIDLNSGSDRKKPSVLDRLRRFGIDRIDLYSQHDPDHQDVSVNIGKYLSRDLYISLNRSLNSDANAIKLEANIIRHVKFHAELNDEATSRLQLMWKHDY